MSKRPNNAKKVQRLRKLLATGTLPAYIDLVDWLKDRGHASTTGQAKQMLLDGRVKVASNSVGRRADSNAKAVGRKGGYASSDGFVLTPFVDARHRNGLRVVK